VNHNLKSEIDNPTIGILLSKDKDEMVARYALDDTNSPIGISEYQLSELYPADFKGMLPSIEDIGREPKDVVVKKKGGTCLFYAYLK
jgi:hypothetical protein